MDVYRAITIAACPIVPTPACPAALSAFRAASKIESGIQRLIQGRWEAQQAVWKIGAGKRSAFPKFDFPIATGTEEDLLRSWKHEFEVRTKEEFSFRIQDDQQISRSVCRRSQNGWSVSWVE